MPAQTPVRTNTAYYSQWDTAPNYRRQLLQPDGVTPLSLDSATSVTITIARSRYDHYYSPYGPIVERDTCTIEAPAADGWVYWTPGITRDVDALYIPGAFDVIFEVNWSDGTRQTVGPNTYEKIYVRTKPGGFRESP